MSRKKKQRERKGNEERKWDDYSRLERGKDRTNPDECMLFSIYISFSLNG